MAFRFFVFFTFLILQPAFASADYALPPLITTVHPSNGAPKSGDLLDNIGSAIVTAPEKLAILDYGDLAKYFINLKTFLIQQLKAPSVKSYFPNDAQNNATVSPIANHINSVILKNGVNSDSAKAALRYASGQIFSVIVDKVMQTNGVKDPSRRAIWTNKIVGPFYSCMDGAPTPILSLPCLDILQKDGAKNIGLGTAYELSRQEIAGSLPSSEQAPYMNSRASEYSKCLAPFNSSADSRVTGCVLQNMREGILQLSKEKVTQTANAQVPHSADKIWADTLPNYNICLAKASNQAGFKACANALTVQAGGELVSMVVLTNKTLLSTIKNPADQKLIAANAQAQFIACGQSNINKGVNDSSGYVAIDSCKSQVTNAVTYKVILATYQQNLDKNLPKGSKAIPVLYSAGKKYLDNCWNGGNEAPDQLSHCLRNSVAFFATTIANNLLNAQIPEKLSQAEPNLQAQLIGNLTNCLNKNLPMDVATSNETSPALDQCTGKLMRSAALKVAEFQLRGTLANHVDQSQSDSLIEKYVTNDFAECLGESPNSTKLNTCTVDLKLNAGKAIGELLFPAEYDKYTINANPPLKVDSGDKKAFLNPLQESNSACLEKNITLKNPAGADTALNSCFKNSIRSFALHIGDILFKQLAGPHFAGNAADQSKYQIQFDSDLGNCLDTKKDNSFDLNAYSANINTCSNNLTQKLTSDIAKYQLASAINSNLPGTDPAVTQLRDSLSSSLTAELTTCLAGLKPEDGVGRNKCTDDLQRDGTYQIALNSGRLQAKQLLNAITPPKEEIALEAQLQTCTQNTPSGEKFAASLDSCTKKFALNLGRSLGHLALQSTLSGALGGTDYKAAKPDIDDIEKNYNSCLDKLCKLQMGDSVTAGITACAGSMKDSAISLLEKHIQTWMSSPNDTPQSRELKAEIVPAIPCVSGIMISAPYNEDAIKHLDPDGFLKKLTATIGDYINYDASKAGTDLPIVLQKVLDDLASMSGDDARKDLITTMANTGMIDQLLKSIIRSQIEEAFNGLSKDQQIPSAMKNKLLDKSNFDAIFDSATLKSLSDQVAKSILVPTLVNGKSLNDPELIAAQNVLKKQIAGIMLNSPKFGTVVVSREIQNQMDSMNGFVKFFGFLMYGNKAVDWSKARNSEKGKAAEAYIKDNIMKPMFTGDTVSPADQAEHAKEAQKLVTDAVQS